MVTGGLQAMDGDVSYKLDDESGRKSPGNIMHFSLTRARSTRKSLMTIFMLVLGCMVTMVWGLTLVTGQGIDSLKRVPWLR
jgi:long-chain fatty acid transport protein